MHYIPILSTCVTFAFAAAVLARWRHKKGPHLLLWGRRAAMCKKPAGARPDDSMYGWTPDILRAQLLTLARAKREVPGHLRRQPAPPKPSA